MINYKEHFPLLRNDPELVYLDNAATTQKPDSVLTTVQKYYLAENANPLRGLYALSQTATDVYEEARQTVANFIGAKDKREIVFTRNASESLNLIAFSLSELLLKEGDEILITIMEHHSNMLPWQQAAKRHKAKLVYLYPDENGYIQEEELRKKLSSRTKILSMTHLSNVLGTEQDIARFIRIAHENGTVVSIDGSQAIPHLAIDVTDLDCDFYSFSGHKIYSPMGIGVLYGKSNLLEKMPPFLTGGEMIEYVNEQSATFAPIPYKFEAGTQNVGGAAGLSAGIKFMQKIGYDEIVRRERDLSAKLGTALRELPFITVYGDKDSNKHHGVFAFNVKGVHPHDVSSIMDEAHIAIRGGHHCAQPLMKALTCNFSCRASLAFYNDETDIEKFIRQLIYIRGYFNVK